MKTLALYALEVLACSGVLLAAYSILLERRVAFRWCRAYLLTATLLAAVIPLLRIPVWPGGVIELAPTVAEAPAAAWDDEPFEIVETAAPTVTPEAVCLVFYLLGAGLIAGVMIAQAVRIRRLRRGADISRTERFTLVRTRQPIASFSFFRSIYIWRQTPAEELPPIVAHEASHIAHRHSLERIVMECMKAALWWNPFAWIAARRLTEAEEFEADSDVLAGGYDREHYMNVLFKQLFGYSPEIANGLRDSLTKKRFQMMISTKPSRYALLRLAGTLPAVIGLLCAFSFTTRAAEIRIPETGQTPADKVRAEKTRPVQIAVTRDGKPLPGAVVLIAGTTTGTVTDEAGNATIDAAPGSTLVVTYVGCESQEIEITPAKAGSEKIRVAMKTRANDLDPIRVTPDVKSNEPLYIVDGVEQVNIYDHLSIEMIENIHVLKNQSAIAAYGERGRNGVIEITTKKVSGPTTDEVVFDKGTGTIKPAEPSGEDEAFLIAEVMPMFQGGDLNTFRGWVQPRIEYPAEAKEKNIQGRVVLSFVIETDGSVSDIQVLQSPGKLLADEACRVVASSPAGAWSPGEQRGRKVRVKYTLPVDFRTTPEAKKAAVTAADDDEPFLIVEAMPMFRGGDINNFRKWIQMQIKYPAEAMQKNIQGRVIASFVVETDGSLKEIQILQSPDKLLTDEARRVIGSAPAGDWKPGMQRGQAVRVKYTLPIDFYLQDSGKSPEQTEKPKGSLDRIVVVGYGTPAE